MYALFSGSYMYMPATLMDWCNFLDYVLIFICKFISRVTLFFSSYVYIKNRYRYRYRYRYRQSKSHVSINLLTYVSRFIQSIPHFKYPKIQMNIL